MIFGGSQKAFQTLAEGVGQGFERFKDPNKFFKRLGNALKKWTKLDKIDFQGFVNAIYPKFNFLGLVKVLADTLGWTFENVRSKADQILPGAIGFFMSAAGALQEFADKGIDAGIDWIKDILGTWADKAFEYLQQLPQKLEENIGSLFTNVITDILPGFIAKLVTKLLVKAVPGAGWILLILDVIAGFLESCPGLRCLLNKFVETVDDVVTGKAVGTIATKVEQGLSDTLVPIFKFIAKIAQIADLPGKISEALGGLEKKADELLQKLVEAVFSPIERVVKAVGAKFGIKSDDKVFAKTARAKKQLATVWIDKGGTIWIKASPTKDWDGMSAKCKKKVQSEKDAVEHAERDYDNIRLTKGIGKEKSRMYRTLVEAVYALAEAIAEKCELDNECDSGFDIVYRTGFGAQVYYSSKGPVFVYGEAQETGSDDETTGLNPHAETVRRIAEEQAKTGKYQYLTMDLAWRTATGRENPSGFRPDIIGIRCDGKVDAWEVLSEGDTARELRSRLSSEMQRLPDDKQGEIRVLDRDPI